MAYVTTIEGLAAIREELADLYRDLHQHPELSLQETRTAGILAQALRPLGYEVTERVGGTGVVGVLRNGPGPTVMLRADFDALPVEEKTGLPYASQARATDGDGHEVPVMHACGHDMHAACLVGAASLLASAKESWSGTLLLVFQPAEELARGARDMVDDGVFDRFPKPSIVLGQHVAPLPAGFIGHGSGPLMAGADTVRVTLHGRGGHGSRPEAAIDPVLMAANVVTRPRASSRARCRRPRWPSSPSVGSAPGASPTSSRTTRSSASTSARHATHPRARAGGDRADRPRRVRRERRRARAGHRVAGERPGPDQRPGGHGDHPGRATAHFGPERIFPMPPVTASEDVGVFGEALGVPTVFWFWGGLEPDVVLTALAENAIDKLPANHSPTSRR